MLKQDDVSELKADIRRLANRMNHLEALVGRLTNVCNDLAFLLGQEVREP